MRDAWIWFATIGTFTVLTVIAMAGGASLFLAGSVTVGTVYLLINYAQMLIEPFDRLVSQLQEFQRAIASIGRIDALFAERSGVTLEEVAYKDAVPAIQDLIGGRIHVTFPDIVIGESYVRSGQVKALAVTSQQRAPQWPNLETVAETFPGFEVIAFLSFSVRKEVPVAIQQKLNRWVMEALYKPEVMERLLKIGITPPPRDWDIAKSDAFVKRERELWTKYTKLAKTEPQ